MIKNVIFDLYGTLIDIWTDESYDGFFEKIEELFKCYKDLKGHLKELYLTKCQEKQELIEEIDLLEVFKEIYEVDDKKAYEIALTFRMLSLNNISLYPKVTLLLEKLKKKGYKIFLLSNAQRCFTIFELYALDIDKYFDKIYLSSDYGMRKPNHEFFMRPILDYDLLKPETLMIGNDCYTDIKGSLEVGLKTIYIETETSTKNVIKPDIKGFKAKKIYRKIKSFK